MHQKALRILSAPVLRADFGMEMGGSRLPQMQRLRWIE